MSSPKRRFALLAATVVCAAGLFFVFRGGGDSSVTPPSSAGGESAPAKAPPAPVSIRLKDGEPVGGPAKLRFMKGERVRFTVIPDAPGVEIHVHGYDIYETAVGKKPIKFSFPADLEGAYEVETHSHSGGGVLVATLEVRAG